MSVERPPRVLVVGGCFCDVTVRPPGPTLPATSNVAEVRLAAGGVGRNVAVSLSRLGCAVTLVGAIGSDAFAEVVRAGLATSGVEPRLVTAPRTGTYVAVLHPDGTLERGYCELGGIERLTAREALVAAGPLERFDGAVLEANLPGATVAELAGSFRAAALRYALDPVSDALAPRVAPALRGCALVKPNQTEARALTGVDCTSREGSAEAARRLREAGAETVVVSRSADGFHLLTPGFEGHVAAEQTELRDVSGAGDALLASAFAGRLRGLPAAALARAMTRCAALACGSPEPVSDQLGPHLLAP